MIYFFEESQRPLMESFVAERRTAGLPMELIDGTAARAQCPALSPEVARRELQPARCASEHASLVEALVRAAGSAPAQRSDRACR